VKVLLTGGTGQLGRALRSAVPTGIDLVAPRSSELDVTRPGDCELWLRLTGADVVVNAAAYTMVDRAEELADLAYAVNSGGAAALAAAAAGTSARMIQISTDFVFDGRATAPYGTDAPTSPLGVYGASKRDGELAVLAALGARATVVRTAWIYDAVSRNFFTTMLRLLQERGSVNVVNDQMGSPTRSASLARAVWRMVGDASISGVHHWTDAGEITWFEFAVAIERLARDAGLLQRPAAVHAIRSDEYPAKARRPRYSVLDTTATSLALGFPRRDWLPALEETVRECAHLGGGAPPIRPH
jgi:dTDP-4-dehydrorhamnose reductase